MLDKMKAWFRNIGAKALKETISNDPLEDYRPSRFYASELMLQDLPLFRLWHCFLMETDAAVGFAERIRNGALLQGEVIITAKDPEVGKFVREQWNKLWKLHGQALAKTKRYGYAAFQVLYVQNKVTGHHEIDDLRVLSPADVRPRTIGGRVVGFDVKGERLFMPQALWTTFDAEGRPYGNSIYRRAYPPWFEKWMEHGAKKVLQLRMIKDAYMGLKGRYPMNEYVERPDGSRIPWRDVIREMAENSLAGATMVLPSDTKDGKNKFDIEAMTDSSSPEGIYKWVDSLDGEIEKGMDVFPEVVQASQSGSGYSGRSLPVAMFLLAVQAEFQELVQPIDTMVLGPLVWMNFGETEYKIEPKSLLKTFAEQMAGTPMGGSAMGGPQSGAPQPNAGGPPGPQPPQGQPAIPGPGSDGGQSNWVPQSGPRGGHILYNPATNQKRYGQLQFDESRKFASTQFNLPPYIVEKMVMYAGRILPDDIIELEDEPHVTVLFGLHDQRSDQVRHVVATVGPLAIAMGQVNYFASPEHDVLFVEIRSNALRELHERIAESCPHTQTHPTYRAHATIAYLKPGTAKKYHGDTEFEGLGCVFTELAFSPADGELEYIPLGGLAQFAEHARAPAGFTHQNPLMIGGIAYVGGEFIPGASQAMVDASAREQAGWSPHTSESGVSGWKSTRTGRIVYGDDTNHLGTNHEDPGAQHGDQMGTVGGGSESGGLPGQRADGEQAPPAPTTELPATGQGTGEGSGELHRGASGGREEAGGSVAGSGDRSADGEGADGSSTLPDGRGRVEDVEQVLSAAPSESTPTDTAAGNWVYHTRDFAVGGLKTKFRNNIAALEMAARVEREGRQPTAEEQAVMSKFVGWGQFPALFNERYYDPDNAKRTAAQKEIDATFDPKDWENESKTLKSLLGDEEFESAKRSVLNAHFTHPSIVDAHWRMARKLGYTGGRFLETSAGIGYYMGMMPADMARDTNTSAVELDESTGRMLKYLYPKANVAIQGFQDFQAPDNFYDLQASNVPFGRYNIYDPRYNHLKPLIHDYFFLKSADLAKPGGLIMHITSKGTLDKPDAKIREELAKTCDLVSAVRFPARAHHENAGTDVVTDMLILRKRHPGEEPVTLDHTPAEAMPPESVARSLAKADKDTFELRHRIGRAIDQLKIGTKVTSGKNTWTLTDLGEDGRFWLNDDTGEGMIGAQLLQEVGAGAFKGKIADSLLQRADKAESIGKGGFTGVTTDKLGRLYHWKDGVRVPAPDWLEVTQIPDPDGGQPITVNKYFAANPENVLGRIDRSGTMYRGESENVSIGTPEELSARLGRKVKVIVEGTKRQFVFEDTEERVPSSVLTQVGSDLLREKIDKYIDRLPSGVMSVGKNPQEAFQPDVLPAPGDVKDGGLVVQNDKLYHRVGGGLVEIKSKPEERKRIAALLRVRDARRAVINAEFGQQDAETARRELNEAYDAYVAEYGPISAKRKQDIMREDPDWPTLTSLEQYDAASKTATKTDIFRKETVRPPKTITHADTISDAYGASLHEFGKLNIEHMAKLRGIDIPAVEDELRASGVAFEDPSKGWTPADVYLSGNVRQKLIEAQAAAAADPKYKANVERLLKVQPEDKHYTEIGVQLGAPWIPGSDIAQFAGHLIRGRAQAFDIRFAPHVGWTVELLDRSKFARSSKMLTETWGAGGKRFDQLLEAALSNKQLEIKGGMDERTLEDGTVEEFEAYDSETGKPLVNRRATSDVAAKIQEIKDAFNEWIWDGEGGEERQERLSRLYNDNFNNIVDLKYNGQHQSFPGMNPNIKLHPHIKDFAWQVVTTGNGLAAHEVGTGKTYAMIASAMELRRLGLARKPAIACLKANIEQITRDALLLYPGAKILSTVDMFDKHKRKETLARMATGDYDLVIMTHDHLNSMKMRPAVRVRFIQNEIKELEKAIVGISEDVDEPQNNRVVKQLEKRKLQLLAKIQEALKEHKKDDAVYFEETGIDQLFVDEAHKFKTLPVYTKLQRVKGVPTGQSDRATTMLMRTQWLREQNGGRGVVFATGTPVSNTMAELYNMQRYLQPEELKQRGIHTFDDWVKTFASIDTRSEFNVAGQYKPTTRMGKYANVPELMSIARQVMDVKKADELKRPDGSNVIVRPVRHDRAVIAPESPAITALMQELSDRAEEISQRRGPPQKGDDNMLVICTDGRKGALDMRLLDDSAPDDPNSKLNLAINNVLKLHKINPNGTQIIFSDLGIHEQKASTRRTRPEPTDGEIDVDDDTAIGSAPTVNADDDEATDMNDDFDAVDRGSKGKFRLYSDVIDKLVAGGIPREQIADFSQLEGQAKEDAQAAMRRGEIKVAIGSTEKLGTGTNVQDRLFALHHLDVPWTPASVEQRDGRAYRHGNLNPHIGIYRYVTEGSLDQKFWDIVSTKKDFIDTIMTQSDPNLREFKEDDSEVLTPQQLTALASGDPRVMEKVDLAHEVKRLQTAKVRHEREQTKAKRGLAELQSLHAMHTKTVENITSDIAHVEQSPRELTTGGDEAGTVETYTTKGKANAALAKIIEEDNAAWKDMSSWEQDAAPKKRWIGTYRGLKVMLPKPTDWERNRDGKPDRYFQLITPSGETYSVHTQVDSFETGIERMKRDLEYAQHERATAESQLKGVREKIGQEFKGAAELAAKSGRLMQVNTELESGAPYVPPTTESGKKSDADDSWLQARDYDQILADKAAKATAKQPETPSPDTPIGPTADQTAPAQEPQPKAEEPTPPKQEPSKAQSMDDMPEAAKSGFETHVLSPLRAQVQKLDDIANNKMLGPRYAWEASTQWGAKAGDDHAGTAGLKRWVDHAKSVGFENADSIAKDHPELKDLEKRLEAHRAWGDEPLASTPKPEPVPEPVTKQEPIPVSNEPPKPPAKPAPKGPIFFLIGRSDKDRAEAMGAIYHKSKKKWYAPNLEVAKALAKHFALEERNLQLSESDMAAIFAETAHAPKGFTHQNPLVINGQAYIGGEFIPNTTQAQVNQAAAEQTGQAPAVAPSSQGPQAAPPATGQPAVYDRNRYLAAADRVLKATSRTASGVVDTSASAGKAEKMASDLTADLAAQRATMNFQEVIGAIYDQRHEDFSDPARVLAMCDKINAHINRGITKDGVLLRTEDTKYPYTKVEHLQAARKQFAEEFAQRLSDPNADPIETAAWVEWRTNIDHAYADGVGKTQRALAAIPLMRADLPLPNYEDPKKTFKYFPAEAPDPTKGGQAYLGADWQRFKNYYRMRNPAHGTKEVRAVEQQYPPGNREGIDALERHSIGPGQFTPQRTKLHNEIVQSIRGNVPQANGPKEFHMMGGGPASGKSSIIKAGLVRPPENKVHIDSDEIKGHLPEFQALKDGDIRGADYVHEESSELSKRVMGESFSAGQHVMLDGTGDSSVESMKKKSDLARKNGYTVHGSYTTCSTEEAVRRNLIRAYGGRKAHEMGITVHPDEMDRKGEGRLPPEDMLRAVHAGVSRVVPSAIAEGLFDTCVLYDTEHKTPEGKPTLVMSAKGKTMTIHDHGLWTKFVAKAEEGKPKQK